ncbi:MAG TPA: DNA repair protein RecO [Atopostipes sp.]|nr:DNA repair protein RecO [Atopostipes sp.]
MAHLEEVEGIVLYQRKHRERDFLVKIFTQRFGKIMFFVRGAKRPQGEIYQAIQPFTKATFIADIRESGLSFLRGAKNIEQQRDLQLDIFNHAYATYISALIDAALEDHIPDYLLYQLLTTGLHLIDEGYNPEVISNILEVKFLEFFGVGPNFRACSICGKTKGVFDYSDKYHGILCAEHFFEDPRRLHVDPKAIHLIRLYSVINLETIGEISIKKHTQEEIKRLIDHIYDQLVGLRLKSKKFIDNLYKWEDTLKKDN